ncbi:hypothetical protein JCM10207_008358 [Rhodosporidiobolus poonsookiae]
MSRNRNIAWKRTLHFSSPESVSQARAALDAATPAKLLSILNDSLPPAYTAGAPTAQYERREPSAENADLSIEVQSTTDALAGSGDSLTVDLFDHGRARRTENLQEQHRVLQEQVAGLLAREQKRADRDRERDEEIDRLRHQTASLRKEIDPLTAAHLAQLDYESLKRTTLAFWEVLKRQASKNGHPIPQQAHHYKDFKKFDAACEAWAQNPDRLPWQIACLDTRNAIPLPRRQLLLGLLDLLPTVSSARHPLAHPLPTFTDFARFFAARLVRPDELQQASAGGAAPVGGDAGRVEPEGVEPVADEAHQDGEEGVGTRGGGGRGGGGRGAGEGKSLLGSAEQWAWQDLVAFYEELAEQQIEVVNKKLEPAFPPLSSS